MDIEDKQAVRELEEWLYSYKISYPETDIQETLDKVYEASKYTGMSIKDICHVVPLAFAGREERRPISSKDAGKAMRDVINRIHMGQGGENT